MNLNLKDIDIRSIIKDVMINFWVVLLAAVTAALAVAGVYTLTYKPQYTSTATLVVTVKENNGGSYSSLYLTNEMAGIFSEVFQSAALRKEIAKDLDVSSLNAEINVSIIKETNLMTLTVVSDTPKSTYTIIKSALKNYGTISDYLFSNAKLDVLKEPSVPNSPSNPMNISSSCKLAGAAGAVLAVGAIAVFSFLRSTVKNTVAAKRQLDGDIIGTVPYVNKMRNKDDFYKKILKRKKTDKTKAVLVSSVTLGMGFIESMKKIETLIERHLIRKGEKVLVVTSVAENEGKSSVASNIALVLSSKGYKTLIIDADLKKPAICKIFEKGIECAFPLGDFLADSCSVEELFIKQNENLDLICQYSGEYDSISLLSSSKFSELILYCRERYDYIIIDTPPMCFSVDAENIIEYSDAVVTVVRQDWSEIGIINDTSDSIRKSGKDFVGIILNRFKEFKFISDYGYGYGYYGKYSNYGSYKSRGDKR